MSESDIAKIEYKIRPVTRYVVTRYEQGGDRFLSEAKGTSVEIGTYPNPDVAYEVGYALAKADHERLGFPVGDERVIYPQHPHDVDIASIC